MKRNKLILVIESDNKIDISQIKEQLSIAVVDGWFSGKEERVEITQYLYQEGNVTADTYTSQQVTEQPNIFTRAEFIVKLIHDAQKEAVEEYKSKQLGSLPGEIFIEDLKQPEFKTIKITPSQRIVNQEGNTVGRQIETEVQPKRTPNPPHPMLNLPPHKKPHQPVEIKHTCEGIVGEYCEACELRKARKRTKSGHTGMFLSKNKKG